MQYKKLYKQNKKGEIYGPVQIKQATNSLTSVQHSKWAR